jgi:hypothetical protein
MATAGLTSGGITTAITIEVGMWLVPSGLSDPVQLIGGIAW